MKLSNRLALIVGSTLLGMVVLGGYALSALRDTMIEERKAGVATLVRLASNQAMYYQGLEKQGKLSREEAQKAAKEAMRALRDGDDFVFARGGERLLLSLVHPDPRKENKEYDGGKAANGMVTVDAYAAALNGQDLKPAFVSLFTKRPKGEVDVPKINVIERIPDWGWVVGSGAFIDDIDAAFWRYVTKFLLIGGILLGGIAALAISLARGIYRSIGGEPTYAADVAHAIASGDLSREVNTRQGENSLLAAVAEMQNNLKQMIVQIKQGADTLSASSDALTEQMSQINVAAQHSAEATASTAASIQQMTVSVSQISDNADESKRMSERASQLAESGGKLVDQVAGELHEVAQQVDGASVGIQGLAERSREIDGIVRTIKEIADQTNLLALNAAIEAARAGEQGRGFAVVADEVRKLAERSSHATDEIAAMIRAIQGDTATVVESMQAVTPQVARGVEVAAQAGRSLQEINEGAGKTLANIQEVAYSTAEQRTASNNVATNVERISQMVEEMAAAVESANANVQALEDLASSLRNSVTRFRI